MAVKFIPNARVGTDHKINQYYTGRENKEFIAKVSTCNSKEPLLINIVKLYNKPSCLSFDAFGRILSGTISKKQQVKILGENYSLDDEEDLAVKPVTGLFIHQGRYKVEIDNVKAGNWILIEGIDQSIIKVNFISLGLI
jgi:116 kDa U5 small nuclear ribonucleoprotein component